jgi:hypothetical protein
VFAQRVDIRCYSHEWLFAPSGKDTAMDSTLGVILLLALVAALAVIVWIARSRLVSTHRLRTPRLRLLTGTRSQQAAIVVAVRPVVRELAPGLEAAGIEVSSIALLPSLAGSTGEPLQAQLEQVNGTNAFIVRLAHMVGGTLRRPDEVAGALAEELLALYRDTAAVTIVRQTPGAVPATILAGAEKVGPRKDGRSGVVPQPRAAAREETEGTVVAFRPNPLGSSTNGHAT